MGRDPAPRPPAPGGPRATRRAPRQRPRRPSRLATTRIPVDLVHPEDDPPSPHLHHRAHWGRRGPHQRCATASTRTPPRRRRAEVLASGASRPDPAHEDRPGVAQQSDGQAHEQRRVHPAPSSTGGWLLRSEPWHGSGPAQGLVRGSAALRYSQAYGRPLPCPLCAVPWPSLSNPTPKEGTHEHRHAHRPTDRRPRASLHHGGTPVCTVRLATNRPRKDGQDQAPSSSTW